MPFVETIARYIQQQQLLDTRERYLVALSGGADSVCLMLVLMKLGYQLEAVHCNFHLRGEESNRDEDFVKGLCESKGIELHLIHFDTETYARTHQVSIEMAARELRYRYFEQLRADIGAAGICVAHHQDDSVETILMNLVRGTGIHGLTGIKPRNGHVLRPLLCVSRTDIIDWLAHEGQPYVTDSSNLQANIVRNKVRLSLLPVLEQLAPSARSSILKTASRLQQATLVYDAHVGNALSRLRQQDSICVTDLLSEPSPESILFEWLTPYGFTPAVIEQVSQSLPAQSGREWTSSTHQMTINRDRLIIEPKQPPRPTLRIPETGTYIYDETAKIRVARHSGIVLEKNPDVACLDAAKIVFPLTLRPIQPGDRFRPYGMKGTQLISDYLTNRRLSIFEKRRTLVLCDAQDRILWLVSHRPAAPFCITDSTTQTLMVQVCL